MEKRRVADTKGDPPPTSARRARSTAGSLLCKTKVPAYPASFRRVPQDPESLILVRDVDVAARVDEDIFRLHREPALRERAVALFRVRWHEVRHLARHGRHADVVDA